MMTRMWSLHNRTTPEQAAANRRRRAHVWKEKAEGQGRQEGLLGHEEEGQDSNAPSTSNLEEAFGSSHSQAYGDDEASDEARCFVYSST